MTRGDIQWHTKLSLLQKFNVKNNKIVQATFQKANISIQQKVQKEIKKSTKTSGDEF